MNTQNTVSTASLSSPSASSNTSGSLTGKVFLVTGGTSGIGLAAAELLASDGARVIVTGRSPDGLATAKKTLGPNALVLQSDAGDAASAASLVSEIRARGVDRLDGAFINAGVGKFGPIEAMTPQLFDDMFNINVRGAYFTVQALLPLLPRGGAVLFNASVASRIAMLGTSIYAATKAAVASLGRTLAVELAPRGIRVNTVSPGPVSTPIFDKLGLDPDAARATREYVSDSTLVKRFGAPAEIAQLVRFLLTDASSFIVGEEIVIDGGVQLT